MTMRTNEINAGTARYLSEIDGFKNGLPFGVVNKTKTDVGGTYLAANCPSNYIIVVPFRDTADSVEQDRNNRYPVFKCYGGITERNFRAFLKENKSPRKIVVTYDSFPKITDWIGDTTGWKVLIDEYQSILEDVDYRGEAINKLLSVVKRYTHFTFLSATPIQDEYEIKFLSELPHYVVKWDGYIPINVHRYKTTNVAKGVAKTISHFMQNGMDAPNADGEMQNVRELYIFINSVTTIEQICRTIELDPDDVKICCADRQRNRLLLGKYKIESVNAPSKRINFFTRKCFAGCNLFTDSGMVIVVSDCYKTYKMIDIATTMEQISGRIRNNDKCQNAFRNHIMHIYSTMSNVETEESFEEAMRQKDNDARIMMEQFNLMDSEGKDVFSRKLNLDSDFVYIQNGVMKINELKRQYFRFKHKLRMTYKDGWTVRAAYGKSQKFKTVNQMTWDSIDLVMKQSLTVSYEELLKDYLTNPSESCEQEYPEFALFRKYLKKTEMNTLRWNKDKMMAKVEYRQMLEKVFRKINKVGFYPTSEMTKLLTEAAASFGYTKTVKAPEIKRSQLYHVESTKKTINGKQVRGYEIGDYIFRL